MHTNRLARTLAAVVVVGALSMTGAQAAPPAAPTPAPSNAQPPGGPSSLPPTADEPVEVPEVGELVTEIPSEERDATLGEGWETSSDQAWTLSGDPSGLHVLVADAADGYAWRTVATLTRPGVETDRWIGNACLTSSGDRLVVAYAPRSFTNEPELFLQGAWTATVDLASGAVTDLPVRGSLEYFTPSCGFEEQAVLTVSGGEEINATRLVSVDAGSGQVAAPVEVGGQVTSAIPTRSGLVAAIGAQVARVEPSGHITPLARAKSVPYELATDADGGVVFLDHDGTTATVHRLDAARLATPKPRLEAPVLARGPLTEVGVTRTAHGQVLLTGKAKPTRTLPSSVRVAAVGTEAEVSADGSVVVDVTSDRGPVATPDGSVDPTATLETLETRVTSLETGRAATVDVIVESTPVASEPPAADGPAAPPVDRETPGTSRSLERTATTTTGAATTLAASGDPTGVHDPVDVGRGCSVPRNSVLNQAVQPKPRQVEWAVNQAVKGVLNVQRPNNWKNLAMPAYKPQTMFPSIPLSGGGEVPSQIMLGILAQESNLWQANGYVVPGVTGSPLIGNYYGIDYTPANPADLWNPDFASADCGYGVSQVTDGMRLSDTGMPGGRSWNQQRAIALDFAANVAAGLQILQEKWNQTRNAGMTINDGNPAKIENWFYAIWAYNSGFYPEADKDTLERNGAWGVGWNNNPVNPSYSPSRGFFHKKPSDATHPQDWPYPEKVIGFAAFPPSLMESPGTFVGAYRAAWWNGENSLDNTNRLGAKPPVDAFCSPEVNDCAYEPGMDAQCFHENSNGVLDHRCWYHEPVTYKANCSVTCGNAFLRFVAGYAYQEDGNAYPPVCTTAELPAGTLVVDDVPAGTPVVRGGCSAVPSVGSFRFTFNSGSDPTEFPSKMDLHQLGAGFGGHFWFGHTRQAGVRGDSMEFTGSWTLDRELHQWARVLVHVPDHGAHTRQATYRVNTGKGPWPERTILQRTQRNGWVSLGVFEMDGVPEVYLSTRTADGDDGDDPVVTVNKNEDIAFDAVAFVPLDEKPKDVVVALGDSYSSGEGAAQYYAETDTHGSDPRYTNACHRSPLTWSRMMTLPGSSTPVGQRADAWDPALDYHLLACSGAYTWDVDYDERYGELGQLERGFVDESTTLVTLSIGGNDAGFSEVLLECAGPWNIVHPNCEVLPLPGETNFRSELEAKIATTVRTRVKDTLVKIRGEGPNADVMLMGYPKLFSGVCFDVLTNALTPSEIYWLNDLAVQLGASMAGAVADANAEVGTDFATFVSPIDAFDGLGICGNPEQIHGLVMTQTEGEPAQLTSFQSAHPKANGYLTYAGVATTALAGMTP
ncbi:SGNH/GDSL hydrolase family protein [Cellulomonas sp. Leaf334]|uniref:SGNH/GDSL hydrolase family protein n=1 Tax=Cellulomonas sp. Leaf334 TaxID=1736339 RepID=UPI0006F31808|nr:SGNH/GDSL hydrolase family protein [Cellulomonas sp. Leaf334]KQR17354.1 hypothetical protein ASF78_08710 [Cellulomonas sp. Leaf334]